MNKTNALQGLLWSFKNSTKCKYWPVELQLDIPYLSLIFNLKTTHALFGLRRRHICLLWTGIATAITKTCLYNFDPLKPHFYTVKLGFTGVYIIFLISAQNIDCGYSLEPPRRGGSNEYSQSMFLSRNMKNIRIFYLKIFNLLVVKFSIYLNRHVFVMFVWMLLI